MSQLQTVDTVSHPWSIAHFFIYLFLKTRKFELYTYSECNASNIKAQMWGFLNNTKNNTSVHVIFYFFAPDKQYVSIILYKTDKKKYPAILKTSLGCSFFFLWPRLWHRVIAKFTFRG